MNIVVLHYHLNRGGVTQVIFNHLKALDRKLRGERWRAAVLFGGRHDAWLEELTKLPSLDVSLCRLEGLDYDWSKEAATPESLGDQIAHQLDEIGFAPQDTVIHTHNHSLGLNVSLPGALFWLAERGYRILFQIHDFAEDYRPTCFRRMTTASKAAQQICKRGRGIGGETAFSSDLAADLNTSFCYPQAPHIHYAVINQRDHQVLTEAGISPRQLHLLPNPVAEPQEHFARDDARVRLKRLFDVPLDNRYVLYPVRCIRRKNVGEAVLWSALNGHKTTFGFTLPPENAVCASAYESWKQLAKTSNLPCRFEVGRERGLRYPENIAAADLILTTSLVEGFGMVYLESWLTDHMLAGRDLPEITADFVDSGIQLDQLRPNLAIPLEWVESQFADMLTKTYDRVLDDYGVLPTMNRSALQQRIERRIDERLVDFGELDETLQGTVIERVATESRARSRIEELNPWIPHSLSSLLDGESAMISSNAEAVRTNYGFDVIGQRLSALYQSIAASAPGEYVETLTQPGLLIDRYLDARRFRPVAA